MTHVVYVVETILHVLIALVFRTVLIIQTCVISAMMILPMTVFKVVMEFHVPNHFYFPQ